MQPATGRFSDQLNGCDRFKSAARLCSLKVACHPQLVWLAQEDPLLAAAQDFFEPLEEYFAAGCHLNRDTGKAIAGKIVAKMKRDGSL